MARHKKLAIFDLDNTLTDTLGFWAAATGPCVRLLCELTGADEDRLVAAVRAAPAQYRFCDFGSLVNWLDDNGHLPAARTPIERYGRDVLKGSVRDLWFRKQKEMSLFYQGGLEALQQIKKDGGAIALYSDTEASAMIRRFWLLSYNAGGRDVRAAEAVLDLVDHIYTMPSIECDQAILRDVDIRFVQAFKQKMTIWSDNRRKPAPDHTGLILADFGVTADEALFIGDSDKDCGSAQPLGVDFAWYRPGADISADTVATAQRLASPDYRYGLQAMIDSFGPAGVPGLHISRTMGELFSHFQFGPGASFNPDCTSGSANPCPRNDGAIPAQIPVARRLASLFHIQSPRSPMGPASHLPPELQVPASQAPAGKADRGKKDPPAP